MSNPFVFLKRAVAYLVIVAFLAGLFFLVRALASATPTVQASVIAGILGLTVTLVNQTHLKKREREGRLHERKLEAYGRLLDVWFNMMQKQKSVDFGGTRSQKKHRFGAQNSEELTRAIITCKKEFLLWTSSDFIKEWNQMITDMDTNSKGKDSDDLRKTLTFDALLRQIRKDLGHDDRRLKPGELMAMMLVQNDRTRILSEVEDKTV